MGQDVPAPGGTVATRIRILGVPMDCVGMSDCLRIAEAMVELGRRGAVLAINPEKIIQALDDADVAEVIAGAVLLIPDGIGVVLAARRAGFRQVSRVAGADLMPELCGLAAKRGYPVFLYGAKPGVAEAAAVELRSRYPELRVAGCRDGYVPDSAQDDLIDEINASGARMLFVALGSPRQELWMRANLHKLRSVAICQGVGGTFDVLAGRVPRAPEAWQRLHLEWLYRILREPQRLRRVPRLLGFGWKVLRDGVTV